MQEYSNNYQQLGHFLRLKNDKGTTRYKFQNFYIGRNIRFHDDEAYSFVPFGFSGMSSSRQGDLSPASLVFHSNDISRAYLLEMLGGYEGAVVDEGNPRREYSPYTAEVYVCLLPEDSDDIKDKKGGFVQLFTYYGRATAGGWDDTKLTIELTSVIDAVQSGVPTVTLQQDLVGSLPSTSSFG